MKLRQELAGWVGGYPWEIWFTGTFRPERCYKDTIKTKAAFNKYIRVLSETFNRHEIQYFLAVERFKCGFETHCHALIAGVGGVRYRELGEVWRGLYGRETVEGYQPNKGADFYLTKYVTKELCDWDLLIKKNK